MSSISVLELKKLIGQNPDLTIIDIRTDREVCGGCIPGSKCIDIGREDFIEKISSLPKDKTYCLYCASGGRTSMAVPLMKSLGFSNVYDLEGGISSWMLGWNELEKK